MNWQFVIAGALALVGAAIHGGAGEKLVVMRLRTEVLAPTKFGGPAFTKLMIRVTWHVVTIVFVVIGSAMIVCSPSGTSEACQGIGRVAAISFSSFGMLAFALGITSQGVGALPRAMRRHPGPIVFLGVAALAWWGSASG